MTCPAATVLLKAAELNRSDQRRRGNVVYPSGCSDLVVAGDLHGHRANLAKIIRYARLAANPARQLVLQELIHGPQDPKSGHDRSIELVLRAARLKLAHPEQVTLLLANHDIAQLTGNEIMKDGRSYCRSFSEGIEFCFPGSGREVQDALNTFLASLPLAVIAPNRTFISHSLPSPNRMGQACCDILWRSYEDADMRRGGDIYEWTWGRGHRPEQLEQLAKQLDVTFFILAHQHISEGYELIDAKGLYLSSEHAHGCVLHIPADQVVSPEDIAKYVKRIAAL